MGKRITFLVVAVSKRHCRKMKGEACRRGLEVGDWLAADKRERQTQYSVMNFPQ